MRYLSLFSGIEAATVAWHPLGWEPVGFAEIEPFPCAVLAHHYPYVPNLGSVTDITDERIAALGRIDVVVGGSPCQDLSVAGKRNGLAGERSGLFHEQIRIFNAARHFCGARWLIWENVPGAFSSNRGRDFAVVAGSMAGCRLDVPADGWGTEGMALGDAGLVEWCVLDAQWFGVAQRRRRVFAVLDAGNWEDRPPVLLERDGLRGDSPPRREPGEDIAPTIRAGDPSGGTGHGARSGDSKDELIVPVAPTLNARSNGGGGLGTDFDIGGGLIAARSAIAPPPAIPHVAMCLNAGAMGRQDAESETLIPTIGGVFDVGITLLGGGHSNNPLDENIVPIPFDTTQITSAENGSNPQPGAPCHPLAAGAHPPAIAFHGSQDPDVSGDVTHPLGRNQGQEVCIAFNPVQEGMGLSDVATPLGASGGGGNQGAVATAMQVRRLTPRECERLQGFPDDYTRIPWRAYQAAMRKGSGVASLRASYESFLAEHGKTLREPAGAECPDGPRYKALGNSMAVPVMRWIGQRIDAAAEFGN